jgi:ABC-type antimicrobial peptide transport system permease subunit
MFIKSKALFLILQKHLTKKWGRVLLAQAGIMIGIWAISLTSSLSLGLSDKIVTAINSQPSSREINFYKVENGKTNFFEINEAPKFVMLSKSEMNGLKNDISGIEDISPAVTVNAYFKTKDSPTTFNCVDESQKLKPIIADINTADQSLPPSSTPENETQSRDFEKQCPSFTFSSSSYISYFNNNRTNLIGKQEKPGIGEISICYSCGDLKLNEKLGAATPKELIGKEIVIDMSQTPNYKLAGEVFDTQKRESNNKKITKSSPISLKIVSVVDDSKANTSSIFGGGGQNTAYLDFSYFENTIKQVDPSADLEKVGYVDGGIVIKDYNDLDRIIDALKAKKYLPVSGTQFLVAGVKTLFTVFTYFLAGFGLIVLISSIFGIINVMTISVLERRKEIGIIKSLGGNDSDIFVIFLLESMFLGVMGWLLGILLALGSGKLISVVVINLINSNPSWKDNLAQFNISEFTPIFPWQLLAITFGLAVFFTSLSGLVPSIRAAKQNIVEVLRSE